MNTKKLFKPKIKTPIKVAFFSNGPNNPTGYAKVLRELLRRFKNDTDFDICVIDELLIKNDAEWEGIPIYGLNLPATTTPDGRTVPRREYTAQAVYEVLEKVQPDILFILEDSFTLHNLGFEGLIKPPCKTVFYIPLDGGWIPETGLKPLRLMDQIVSMSKFTQENLAREGFDSEMIWHGVDLDLFCPVAEAQKQQLKIKYGFKPDDFVIFNYGRNSNIRKNNQGMLWIMAKYLSEAPENHKFCFHTLDAEFPGNNLIDYVDRHLTMEFGEDIINRILFTPFNQQNPASDGHIAEMIQMSDLIITASTGEGFGLIMAEAMGCGKPVISTDYTTPKELLIDELSNIGPRGWIVPTAHKFIGGLNTEHAYVDQHLFVKTIKDAVNSPEKLGEFGQNGRAFAERYLNWDYLVEQWKSVFKKVI